MGLIASLDAKTYMDKNMKYPLNVKQKWNMKAFTLVELMVSILISVILLWGIFYFLSDTILGIARAGAQSRFLQDFYSFTTILDTGDLTILQDYNEGEGYDVALLTSAEWDTGVIIGVVDMDTKMLSSTWQVDIYHNTVLGYRSLSSTELIDVKADASIIYDYTFFKDKLFTSFNLRDFQLQSYNSGATMDMYLYIVPTYSQSLKWKKWEDISQENLFKYSLTF